MKQMKHSGFSILKSHKYPGLIWLSLVQYILYRVWHQSREVIFSRSDVTCSTLGLSQQHVLWSTFSSSSKFHICLCFSNQKPLPFSLSWSIRLINTAVQIHSSAVLANPCFACFFLAIGCLLIISAMASHSLSAQFVFCELLCGSQMLRPDILLTAKRQRYGMH